MRLIYVDTSVWNIIANEDLEVSAACRSLERKDWQLVLGLNAYFEMLKSFFGKRRDRGSRLFMKLHQFLSAGTPLIRTWEELLVQESLDALRKTSRIDLFCEDSFRSQIAAQSERLASGDLRSGTKELILRRDLQSASVRDSATLSITSQPEMLADLRSIKQRDLTAFLDDRSTGPQGSSLLAKYLTDIFPMFGLPAQTAPRDLAAHLLASKSNRVAHSMARSDIYQCWRAAQKEIPGVRRCVPDDSYHVVNASYCDMFITEDRDGQADAAQYALLGCEVVLAENRETPFFEWLDGVLDTAEKREIGEQVKIGREIMAKHEETFRSLAKYDQR
jgi:hypothetical protein